MKNARVGTKLLTLIAAPVLVLVIVASFGARDRLERADQAAAVEDAATLSSATSALVQELQLERLYTTPLLAGGSDDETVAEQRDETDAVAKRFALLVGPIAAASEKLDDLGTSTLDRVEDVKAVRSSIDNGDADPAVALDSYTLAITGLLDIQIELAADTSVAGFSRSLTNAAVLGTAKEARSRVAAYVGLTIERGAYLAGEVDRFVEGADEERTSLERFLESGEAAANARLRDALASPPVANANELLEAAIASGQSGGSGRAEVDLSTWNEAQAEWMTEISAVEASLIQSVNDAAGGLAFEANKTAKLFLIATIAATILSVLLAVMLARSIDRPLRRLTTAADELASERLPRLVENLRSPNIEQPDTGPLERIDISSKDEIGQLGKAFNAIQQVTMSVAEEQATLLRKGIGDIFVNLARRNQSLLDRQIEFIDQLENRERDPDQLENLFKLDHLATRMRRNAESLLVLAGAEPNRRRAGPVSLSDVVRVAVGEVEHFTRVDLVALDEASVGGNLAVDLSHLVSELMENATHFSPPDTSVEVAGQRADDGRYVLTIADQGIGMSAEQLADANTLLANPPLVGLALGRSLGFIVVGRLAKRLGLTVQLSASPAGGVTAVVELPAELAPSPDGPAPQDPVIDSRARTSEAGPSPASPSDPAPAQSPDAAPADVPSAAPTSPPPPTEADPTGPLPTREGESPLFAEPGDGDGDPAPAPAPPIEEEAPQLADALPEGEAFERGLASLMGEDGVRDDGDVAAEFWGDLGGEPAPPSTPTESGPTSGSPPPPPLESAPSAPAPEAEAPPAPWPDAAAPPPPAPPAPAPSAPVPDPASAATPSDEDGELFAPGAGAVNDRDTAPTGLARRVPKQVQSAAVGRTTRTVSSERSPEEVRAMLSRYRNGLKGGRAEAVDGEVTGADASGDPIREERS